MSEDHLEHLLTIRDADVLVDGGAGTVAVFPHKEAQAGFKLGLGDRDTSNYLVALCIDALANIYVATALE